MKEKRTKKTPAPAIRKKERDKPRRYIEPKTAAELGITCKCGAPCLWFDYELGEKEFYAGFVCDDHKVSNRVEKLAPPKAASVM